MYEELEIPQKEKEGLLQRGLTKGRAWSQKKGLSGAIAEICAEEFAKAYVEEYTKAYVEEYSKRYTQGPLSE